VTDEDVQIVRAAWGAWRDEGPRGILAFLHPEVEWTPAEGEPESETAASGRVEEALRALRWPF
jgi:hypothetical protein